jgi:FixJ family two-component response regulator
VPRVLILEDDEDLRAVMRYLLRVACRVDCLDVASFAELLAHGEEALGCTTALLDVNLGAGQPSGIDAYRWLRDSGFRGPINFLTGHARTHPLVEQAGDIEDVRVLEKPIAVDVLQKLACDV